MMNLITNPAFWASIGALLGAVGLEMIPAQQLAEHIVAAVAGVSGIIGIIHAWRGSQAAQPAPEVKKPEESAEALEKAVKEGKV